MSIQNNGQLDPSPLRRFQLLFKLLWYDHTLRKTAEVNRVYRLSFAQPLSAFVHFRKVAAATTLRSCFALGSNSTVTRVVDDHFLASRSVLANPRESVKDVLASGLAVHAVLVVGEENDVMRAVAFDLRQVGEEIAGVAAGLTELAFLIEIVNSDDDGASVLCWGTPIW